MPKKKAFLVTFSVTTRIIATPDEYDELPDSALEQAKWQAQEALRQDGANDHLEDIEEDQESPYYPEDDETESDGEDS